MSERFGRLKPWSSFLIAEQTVYYSNHHTSPTPENPWSPYTHLIEGVWNHSPAFARKLLRNRIFSPHPTTPLCDGMIKVMAKRTTVLSPETFAAEKEKLKDFKQIEVSPPNQLPSQNFSMSVPKQVDLEWAREETLRLVNAVPVREKRYLSDRPVGAVLFSATGELLGRACNLNAANRTHHAEFLLVREFLKKHRTKIPGDSTFVVSLQPCAMCAAQIYTFSEDPSHVRVVYLQEDPGPFSKNSVGVKNSPLWMRAGRPNFEVLRR